MKTRTQQRLKGEFTKNILMTRNDELIVGTTDSKIVSIPPRLESRSRESKILERPPIVPKLFPAQLMGMLISNYDLIELKCKPVSYTQQ